MSDRLMIQGDVPMWSVPSIPDGAVPVESRVLREGEVTGHAHVVEGDAAVFALGSDLYLSVGVDGAVVVHEEHGTMPLAPGTYRVGGQREYDPYEQAARMVVD